MEVRFIKEIILSNIVAKKEFLKKLNATLFLFKRDFEKLKTKDNFQDVLEEVLEILNIEIKSKQELEILLSEVEKENTLKGINLKDIDTQTLKELAGDSISIDAYKYRELDLNAKVDELLISL